MKKIIIPILFISLSFHLCGQEIVTDIQCNPVIQNLHKDGILLKKVNKSEESSLSLPFLDNFKNTGSYPKEQLWEDNYTFINCDYSIYAPNAGVCTFDAIDASGSLYSNAVPGPTTFEADVLTSRPVRLDSIFDPQARPLLVSDSVYLSFFYQPQGLGNAPEENDSLILEFGSLTGDTIFVSIDSSEYIIQEFYEAGDSLLLPCYLPDDSIWVSVNPYLILHNGSYMLLPEDTIMLPCDSIFEAEIYWQHIWAAPGQSLDTNFFTKDDPSSYWRQVMIAVNDSTKYFNKNFRFRFRNYVSLADNTLPSWQSNADHWNLDMVYLNMGRNQNDSVYSELTFIDKAPSMLANYERMPYPQYVSNPTEEMKDSLDILISNRDTLSHNSIYKFILKDKNNQAIDSCLRGNWDIPSFYESGYLDYLNFSKPPVCFGFFPIDFTKDSASFQIDHILGSSPGSFEKLGDTMSYHQIFHNYYAYDDGTPEAGYGLTPEGSQLAVRFSLNKEDTLRGVQMYFNQTNNAANENYFYLAVWGNDNGIPGKLIYSMAGQKPVFSENLNELHTYALDTALPVNGTFFVGWIQTTDDNMNVGFDRRNNSEKNIFYNVSGEWLQSIQGGSLMIRPVLGKPIIDLPPIISPPQQKSGIKAYPNPVYGSGISISLPEGTDPSAVNIVEIFSLTGQKVWESNYQSSMNISGLNNGIYILRLSTQDNRNSYIEKLIISR